ncbi:MAG TPA: hypothetical protein VN602_05275 [Gemmatimonadaceae bacterium]|nr:hypothetical protein [Gemmatimonadaceae bacterium]
MTINAAAQNIAPGEKLLWDGSPRQGIVLRSNDILMIPFSFLWCGFAIFWETSAITGGAPIFFMLWGIPFVLIGLYMVIGRFFVDAWLRRTTRYAVTNVRVIITSGGMMPSLKSLNLRTLSDVTLTAKPNGRGTITFGSANFLTSMYSGVNWPGIKQPPSFELIDGASGVYEIIRKAQARIAA